MGGSDRRAKIAPPLHDEEEASDLLTEVLDLGYDATLVSEDVDGRVQLELQVGPFGTLREADSTATILRRAMELEPEIGLIPRNDSPVDAMPEDSDAQSPPELEIQ